MKALAHFRRSAGAWPRPNFARKPKKPLFHSPGPNFNEGFNLSFTAQIEDAYAIADLYRARGTKIVLGGLHASGLPEEAAAHAVAVGEGEVPWPRILEDFRRRPPANARRRVEIPDHRRKRSAAIADGSGTLGFKGSLRS